jgi:hypothetical protein
VLEFPSVAGGVGEVVFVDGAFVAGGCVVDVAGGCAAGAFFAGAVVFGAAGAGAVVAGGVSP